MHRQLPNQITVLRLILAAAFFITLNQYRYPDVHLSALSVAIALFVLAVITDWLDGFLARRWKVESAFGRIMDPFCDKVLIIGAFIYLAGPRFVDPAAVERNDFFTTTTGVYPWMVALILARELLVTNIRGELEDSGIHFAANLFGKLKMVLQSVMVPVVLLIVAVLGRNSEDHRLLVWVRDVLVYVTVGATVLSGLPYVVGAVRVLSGRGRKEN